jgi:DNA-binding transcriptional ArsR family regulator
MIGPEMGTTSRLSIGSALFGQTRLRVLGLLFGRPGSRYFLNEIVREAGLGKGTVQRELERLMAAGLIDSRTEGRQRYFRAARESPVFDEIESLVRKTFGLAEVLQNALAPLFGQIEFAGIYGSTATGTAGPRSDVDLLVVGDVEYLALSAALLDAETTLRRAVNPTVYALAEWRRRQRDGGGFLRELLSKPMIVLRGSKDVLAEPGANRKPGRASRGPSRDLAAAGRGEAKPGRRRA